MAAVRRLAIAIATALSAALLVPAAPADAAWATKHATYKGSYDVDGDDFEAYITIKIGGNKKKISKVVAKVTCPGKSKPVRLTWKNIALDGTGSWSQMKKDKKGFVAEIRGHFNSRAYVTGELNFFRKQCDPYQYFGWDAGRE